MAEKSPQEIAEERIEEARRTGASELDLRTLGLTALPESIGTLEELQGLDLSGNDLTALPDSIVHLKQLRRLDLSENSLTTLPEFMGQLKELQGLDLAGNGLTTLPDFIGHLTQLQGLYLSRNKLTSLPDSIVHLKQLQGLNLSGNGLTPVPDSIGHLQQLQELYLSGNGLTSLPDFIGHLTQLQGLYLSRNKLTVLPDSIGRLEQLQQLFLHGNEALGIPPEILGPTWKEVEFGHDVEAARPSDILQFYFRSLREARSRLGEAKILLVGQGGVGKTSLVKRLIDDEFDPDEAKTEGINISRWQVLATKGDSGGTIRANIWDFGGQEIMHATHQFFLTKRSLYILVLDARKGENESNIHKWLKIIQSYGEDSPVLVVTNKCDAHHLELNENRLKRDYEPNVKHFFRISCKDKSGVEKLREVIEAEINALPHVYDEVPESYFQVKEVLEERARTEDYIDIEEYRRICREHQVSEKKDQDLLIRFLHDLGNVLNFDDPDSPYALRETNILNPQWVTDGVYKIINNNGLMQRRGVLRSSELTTILNDHERFAPERHKFIIGMMEKFELSFEFPGEKGERMLIPELLPENEPDLDWVTEAALNFEYHYNVLPEGVMPRFIVRIHHNLTDKPTYWRSGVVLKIEGNKALVRGDTHKARVFISVGSVRGSVGGQRRALSVIRDAFKAIHKTIPKIEAKGKVALPDNPTIVVDYEHLLTLESKNIDHYLPEGAQKEYSVQELLNGVEAQDERIRERLKRREMGLEMEATGEAEETESTQPQEQATLDVKTFLIVGFFLLFVLVVLVGLLALLSQYVSAVAMTGVTIGGILFVILLFVFLARFTNMLGEGMTGQLVEKVMARLSLLSPGQSTKKAEGEEQKQVPSNTAEGKGRKEPSASV